jgi:diguanylate cyclase
MRDFAVMTIHATVVSALIGFLALRKPADYLSKPAAFSVAVAVSQHVAEYLLFGRFIMTVPERLLLGLIAAAPFMVLVFYVVTYLDRQQMALGEQAATDPLTGLMNRRSFMARASVRLGQTDPALRGVVLLIDADHFKRVNDNWGHSVGDLCLIAIAARLRATLRNDDIIARFGGEEFVAYLPATSLGTAVEIGSCLSLPITVAPVEPPGRLRLTLSVGAAEVMPGMTLSEALHLADLALYRAKAEGRARLVQWDGRLRPGEGRAA